jgi:protoporphyrinogen oxidase
VLEAAPHVGGNCRTFTWQDFRYDSGAHRFHDKDPRTTARVMRLLGDEMLRIDAPSRIWTPRGFVSFPLNASSLLPELGLRTALGAGLSYLRRPRGAHEPRTFEELALRSYGRHLSELFLLGYSRKLWGLPCDRLSPDIAGRRLRGLSLSELLGSRKAPAHMEGAFYYPRDGYGRICERLADATGRDRIRTGAAVTRLTHNGRRITRIEVNGAESLAVDAVCSTLPVDLVLRLLRPAADADVLELSSSLRHRSLILVAVFLDTPSVTDSASLYFPDPGVPFTRVVEPRNRSPRMAPDGRTSLVAELPCFKDDEIWQADQAEIAARVVRGLEEVGLIQASQVIGHEVRRVSHAYPVLEVGIEHRLRYLLHYLDRFENLVVTGRNGRFVYRHLHDMLRYGTDAVDRLEGAGFLSRRASGRTHGRVATPAAGAMG